MCTFMSVSLLLGEDSDDVSLVGVVGFFVCLCAEGGRPVMLGMRGVVVSCEERGESGLKWGIPLSGGGGGPLVTGVVGVASSLSELESEPWNGR